MSYCRWSCDDFKSDVYAYESKSGYEVWVADNRIVGDVPHVDWTTMDQELLVQQFSEQHAFLDTCKREPIGLPHDGEHFIEDTPEDLLWRLEYLKELGYHVPDHALAGVREEIDAAG